MAQVAPESTTLKFTFCKPASKNIDHKTDQLKT